MLTLAKRLVFLIFYFLLPLTYAQPHLHFELNGIDNPVLKNAQSRLAILKKSQGDLTPNKIQTIYEQASQQIRLAMQPYGYFRTHIQSRLTQEDSDWTASFTIHPGPKITISQLSVNIVGPGNRNADLQRFIHHFPLKIGDPFRTSTYEKAKEDLFQLANNQGYVNASFTTNKVMIDINHYEVKIILELQTGSQYFFGKMKFKDNPYAEHFLNRFTHTYENTIFSSEKLLKLQQDLSETTYFKNVVITPHTEQAVNQQVPIEIDVATPKAKKYNFGIGYGTFTGPRFTAGISLRRLTDTGQHFDAQLKLSSVLSALAAKYYIPGKNPLTDQWLIGVNLQRFLPKNGSSTSGMLTTGYVTKTEHTQTSLDLNYLVEHYKVVEKKAEKSHFLYPSLNYSYSQSDDVINPSTGKSFNFNLRGASQDIFSSTNFLQAELKGKYFYTPTSFSHLIFRADLGYTLTKHLKNLPLSMRFFAGGMNTIRGYPDSSIGPGRYLYVGSIEYQNRIKNDWWGAVFYDTGTASDHYGGRIHTGAGVGVIYQSLLGPIKLYVAQAVNKPGRPYSLEFSIGPEF